MVARWKEDCLRKQAAGAKYFFLHQRKKLPWCPRKAETRKCWTDSFDEDPGLIGWGTGWHLLCRRAKKTYAHLFRLNSSDKKPSKN